MCLLISRKSTINLSLDIALKKYCDFKSYFVLKLLQAEKIIKNSKPLVVKEKKKKPCGYNFTQWPFPNRATHKTQMWGNKLKYLEESCYFITIVNKG